MKNLFKIKMPFLTIVVIILSIMFGTFKQLACLFIIASIHELFHLLMCNVLKVKVKEISVLPFGFCLSVENVENINSYKQLLIYLAGPISALFNLIWLLPLHNLSIINNVNYNFLYKANIIMSIVNLLPIFPLDGFIIIKAILHLLLPYKKSLKISYTISIIFFLLFLLYNFVSPQIMLTLFLLINQIRNIILYKTYYKAFLIDKCLLKKYKRYKIINNYLMYKDKNNYKIEHDKVLNDSDIALKELNKFI